MNDSSRPGPLNDYDSFYFFAYLNPLKRVTTNYLLEPVKSGYFLHVVTRFSGLVRITALDDITYRNPIRTGISFGRGTTWPITSPCR